MKVKDAVLACLSRAKQLASLVLCAILVIVNVAVSAQEQTTLAGNNNKPINILVILSHPITIPWSNRFIEGLKLGANQHEQPVNLYVESMHAMKLGDENAKIRFHTALNSKYQDIRLDGIIGDSYLAYDYLNWLNLSDYEYSKLPTSVFYFSRSGEPSNEAIDVKQFDRQLIINTTKLIASHNPSVSEIYINSSTILSYDDYFRLTKASIAEVSPSTRLIEVPSDDVDALLSTLATLPKSAAFIYLPVLNNNKGTKLIPTQVLSQIHKAVKMPIYSFWGSFVGHGAIGGDVLEPITAAQGMLSRLIERITTGQVQPQQTLSSWVFDHTVMTQHQFEIPAYVEHYTLVNPKRYIWTEYPVEIALLVIALLCLTVFVFVLRQRRLVEVISIADQAKADAIINEEHAKQLSSAKSKFLATVSHEIRTPINGIFGAINILQDTQLDPQQRKFLDMAKYCSDGLLRTVNDILDFSKLESNKLSLHAVKFSPHHLLHEVIAYANLLAEAKGLSVRQELTQLVDVPLSGDPNRIRQIFDNLVNNAVKFSSSGHISIGAAIKKQGKLYCMDAWVKDTGSGIAKDRLSDLFQPFTQLHDTYQRENEGTGLGLAICHQLVSSMSGTIKVSSTLGVGSEFAFSILLPKAVQIETKIIEKAANDSCVKTPAPAVPAQLRTLLVEDNTINQEIISYQLSKQGLSCVIANHGKEAISMLLNTPEAFDLVLMDIQMPIMDGYTATRAIRSGDAGARYKEVPIIALTAHVSLEEVKNSERAGMNQHLSKPINPDELMQYIRDVV